MKRWTAVAAVLAVAAMGRWAWSEPTTEPAATDAPTTAPAPEVAPAANGAANSDAKPAIAPAAPVAQASATATPVAPQRPATPAAGIAAAAKQAVADVPAQWAVFELSSIAEKPADFSLFGNDTSITLHTLVDRLEAVRRDNNVRGVLITFGDAGLNISQALELRSEFQQVRLAGKKVWVYADEYDTDSYVAALGASDICMLEGGDIMIPGVGFSTMFAKGLLDKVGVEADYVQIGEYKGADEEYTRTEASPELKEQLNGLADSLYSQIIDAITLSRNLSHSDVTELVDQSLIPGAEAKNRGLVDHLVDKYQLRTMIESETGRKPDLRSDYGATPKQQVDLSNPLALFSMFAKRPADPATNKPGVALVYAEGVIVDGGSGTSLFSDSPQIGSEEFRMALRLAETDPNIKAVVVRIDSPGGSALASEVMWQSLRRVAKTKPIIISVGAMAASGGYYTACGGNYIFADPTAIVGSIGVVGGKFVLKDLYAKLGINDQSFLRGRNADLFDDATPWTDTQRRQVTQWMHDTYDQFTQRVMSTREGKIKDIDAVARGRIFTAKQAVDLGMVDRIGGLKDALAFAARGVNLPDADLNVRVLPPERTIADYLAAAGAGASMPFIPHTSLAATLTAGLPANLRHALDEQLEMMSLLQAHPVILACPVVMTEK